MDMMHTVSGKVKVLRLSGRFDNYVTPLINEWFDKNITSESSQIVVNLGQVHFIDSTALATLVQGLNRCHKYEGDLYLCALQQQVYMIFELTRLDKAFNIFLDEDHALSVFAK